MRLSGDHPLAIALLATRLCSVVCFLFLHPNPDLLVEVSTNNAQFAVLQSTSRRHPEHNFENQESEKTAKVDWTAIQNQASK